VPRYLAACFELVLLFLLILLVLLYALQSLDVTDRPALDKLGALAWKHVVSITSHITIHAHFLVGLITILCQFRIYPFV